MHLDGLIRFGAALTVIPRLKADPKEGVVAGPYKTEQAETNHASRVLNARCICEDLLYLSRSRAGALQRRRIRKLHVDVEVALVLIGQETGRQMRPYEPRSTSGHREQHQHQCAFTNYVARQTHKAVGRALPVAVKDAKEFSERPASFFFGSEKQRRKCRAERESVERGKHHGDRDGESELLVESAGNSRNERGGHEHGCQHESNADDWAGKFLHGFQGGISWRQPFFDVVLYAFDDHDGVVNHQSYGEHQPEQRKGINGEAEQRKDDEGSDQ